MFKVREIIKVSIKNECFWCLFNQLEKFTFGVKLFNIICTHEQINHAEYYLSKRNVFFFILVVLSNFFTIIYYCNKIMNSEFDYRYPIYVIISICGYFAIFGTFINIKEKFKGFKLITAIQQFSECFDSNDLLLAVHYVYFKKVFCAMRVLLFTGVIVLSIFYIFICVNFRNINLLGDVNALLCDYIFVCILNQQFSIALILKKVLQILQDLLETILMEHLSIKNVYKFKKLRLNIQNFSKLCCIVSLCLKAYKKHFEIGAVLILALSPFITVFGFNQLLHAIQFWGIMPIAVLVFFLMEYFLLIPITFWFVRYLESLKTPVSFYFL